VHNALIHHNKLAFTAITEILPKAPIALGIFTLQQAFITDSY